MKVILNKDLAPLGEEGDVKEVAKGYARNYLFPREIAMPYTDRTVALLESRRGEIEARKEEKRKDALGIKEKLEELTLVIAMPAGANGRLYGAVTSQTVSDELAKQGFQVERKRIELPGNSFKSVGNYKVSIKLYESAAAELSLTVEGQQLKVETPSAPARRERRRRDEVAASAASAEVAASAPAEAPAETLAEAPVGEALVEAPVGEALVEAPVGEALAEAPVGEALVEAPVGEAPAEAPVGEALVEAAVGEALVEAPVGEALVEAPVGEALGEAPVGEALVEAPESGAPEPVQEESAVEA
jgi:large subunit ribosomal protein L9